VEDEPAASHPRQPRSHPAHQATSISPEQSNRHALSRMSCSTILRSSAPRRPKGASDVRGLTGNGCSVGKSRRLIIPGSPSRACSRHGKMSFGCRVVARASLAMAQSDPVDVSRHRVSAGRHRRKPLRRVRTSGSRLSATSNDIFRRFKTCWSGTPGLHATSLGCRWADADMTRFKPDPDDLNHSYIRDRVNGFRYRLEAECSCVDGSPRTCS
jgi:hypothetical protein